MEEEGEELDGKLAEQYPESVVYFHFGGERVYYYMVSLE